MASPLETYAQVILHSGCAIPPKGETESRKHRWDECRSQAFFLRVARKHQHKLKSNGLAIGSWITRERLASVMNEAWGPDDVFVDDTEVWQALAERTTEILLGPISQQAEETDSKPV